MLRYEAWTAERREADDEISEIKEMLLPLPAGTFVLSRRGIERVGRFVTETKQKTKKKLLYELISNILLLPFIVLFCFVF